MSSIKRILAARANGARSRGPVTSQGKTNSSRNAIRHGLLAKTVLVGKENPDAFKALCDLLMQRFAPVDSFELGMIEEMAASYWRLRRTWAMETEMLNSTIHKQTGETEIARMAEAFAELALSGKLDLLHRYETRLHMMYQRGLHNLLLMRQAGIPGEPPIDTSLSNDTVEAEPAQPLLPAPTE